MKLALWDVLWSLQVWEYKAGRGYFVGLEGLLRNLEILPCREGLLWGSFCPVYQFEEGQGEINKILLRFRLEHKLFRTLWSPHVSSLPEIVGC